MNVILTYSIRGTQMHFGDNCDVQYRNLSEGPKIIVNIVYYLFQ